MKNNNFPYISSFLIFFFSFFYRFWNILSSHPFWVDEFSSAKQGSLLKELGLSIFFKASVPVELHNVLTNVLIAASFSLFGTHEWSARIPFVIIGSFVPVTIYLFSRRYFSNSIALTSGIFAASSYFFITWSRQARGYALQQLLTVLIMYLYLKLKSSPSSLTLKLSFALIAVLGVLTHALFSLVILAIAIHFSFASKATVKKVFKSIYLYITLLGTLSLLFKFGYIEIINNVIFSNIFKTNNLWYYHSFLWREYGLITFLGITGLFISYRKYKNTISLVLIYLILHFVFITFFWPPYTSRYLLSIFPFLLIGVALTLERLFKTPLWILAVTLLIVLNGDKFVIKPKPYYSVNQDFREIAVIDYAKVYNTIRSKGQLEKGQTAVIDTWHDRLYWYLGTDYPNAYLFRWTNDPGKTNGLTRFTRFITNAEGEKLIPYEKNLRFVGSLSDLKRAMKKYPKGFIFIDDASLPKDVLEYVEKNFTKELYLDHYPLDDNPYSIWPATLYSWGIK